MTSARLPINVLACWSKVMPMVSSILSTKGRPAQQDSFALKTTFDPAPEGHSLTRNGPVPKIPPPFVVWKIK